MHEPQEERRVGLDYVEATTTLLQRIRGAHLTKGLYEAADIQWWWARPRPTDSLDQLFWFDDLGRPEAAVIITDWEDRVALDPMFMPDATAEWVAHVVERGLAHARESGFDMVELEVSQANVVLRNVMLGHGFFVIEEGFLIEAWMSADARPEVSSLHEGYRLTTRRDTMDRPHHNERNGPDPAQRLLQTSLYRTDLDLLVLDGDDNAAAYGLFWYDPETATGLVEPMRTAEDHQQKGLARHILTAGVDLLARAGAEHIKIVYEPDNPASGHLYRSVGFETVTQTDAFSGRANPQTS